MKRILNTLAVAVVLFFTQHALCGTYGGGLGTVEDPYLIADPNHMQEIGATPSDWSKHFILTADIDLSGQTYTTAIIAPDISSSYSFQGTTFTGAFIGDNHEITGLTINADGDYIGIFGQIGSGGRIQNIRIKDCNISGDDSVGGLCGRNYGGTIANCYVTGEVTGNNSVGGLCGTNWIGGTISTSYATATVSSIGQAIGGLCGENYKSTILICCATGDVIGSSYIGGLCGMNDRGTITASYAAGTVSGSIEVGGLCGRNNGSITASFWDTQTSGRSSSAGGTGKTTAEMQDINTFLNVGWDFTNEEFNGINDFWHMGESGYPELYMFNDSYQPRELSGNGRAEDPYLIQEKYDLVAVSQDISAFYKMTNDIDLAGITFSTPVIVGFVGSFDGAGFKIMNLTIDSGFDNVSLFRQIGSEGIVTNLGIDDCNISGNESIGALCGRNYGTIVASYTSGTVTGTGEYIGGLCGSNYGTITSSYASGAVSGTVEHIGGLCGVNYGTITSSYATGTVTGGDVHAIAGRAVGGLCGTNCIGGVITSSYAIGAVTSASQFIGGLCGTNRGTITASYASGKVSGSFFYASYLGGLCGMNGGAITNCCATGAVRGKSYVGGLCGDGHYIYSGSTGTITKCYSTGTVVGQSYVGGLCGYGGTTTASFWDKQTSGRDLSAGGTGKTTAEMQDINTFLNAGWDFSSPGVWQIFPATSVFGGYPILQWWPEQTFTVTFDAGVNGDITSGDVVQTVACGGAAVEPNVTVNESWIFIGWDTDFLNITSNLIITAQYDLATRIVELSGDLSFGEIIPGGSDQRLLTISNSGNSVLAVSGINYPTGFSGDWSNGEINAGAWQDVTVTFSPDESEFYFGDIEVISDATEGNNTILCWGLGVSRVISLSGNLDFGDSPTGTSHQQILTITNTGDNILTVGSISCPAGFSSNWSGEIVAGTSQDVTITFSPTEPVAYGGTITVNSNATDGDNTIACLGAGLGAGIALSDGLSFGDVAVDSIVTLTLTITNTNVGLLTVSEISYPTGFSGNWSGEIPAGTSQDIAVNFAPLDMVDYGGAISVSSDAISGDNTIECSGSGIKRTIQIDGDMFFGHREIDSQTTLNFSISNIFGNRPLTVSGVDCPLGFSCDWSGTIAVGASQEADVVFTPTEPVVYGGTITVNSNATDGDNTIACSGAGPGPEIALSGGLSFGDVAVDSIAMLTLTITNTNVGLLTVSEISYPAGFSGSWSGEIPAGTSQDIAVNFAPLDMVDYGGTISVSSDAISGDNTIECGGNGIKRTIQVDGNMFFGHREIDSQTTLNFSISNIFGNRPLTVSGVDCPLGFSCDWSGTIAVGASQEVDVVFTPTAEGDYEGKLVVQSDSTEGENTLDYYGFVYVGDGTPEEPYIIFNRYHLEAVNDDVLACYSLMANIDLASIIYDAAIIAPCLDEYSAVFDGTLNGNGYVVKNLTIESSDGDYLGFFGHIGTNALVSNMGLEEANINGANVVGLIAGQNDGSITDSYAFGSCLATGELAGGIAGHNNGSITKSYANVTISSESYLGGLTGGNDGTITDCYASGSISGEYLAGGLVGINWGSITNCYSCASIEAVDLLGGFTGINTNIISDCFWDVQASGQTSTGGSALGKTTLQMQDISTFLDVGWDFIGEDANGTDDIWRLCVDGASYPKFRWEYDSIGDFLCPDGVAYEDMVYFMDHWLSVDDRADLDGDGVVTLVDFAMFASHWMVIIL